MYTQLVEGRGRESARKRLLCIVLLSVSAIAINGCLGAAARGAFAGTAARGVGMGLAAGRASIGAAAARGAVGSAALMGLANVGSVRAASAALARTGRGTIGGTVRAFSRSGELQGTVRLHNPRQAVIYDRHGVPISRAVLRQSRIDFVSNEGRAVGYARIERAGAQITYWVDSELVAYDLIEESVVRHYSAWGELLGETVIERGESNTLSIGSAWFLGLLSAFEDDDEEQKTFREQIVKPAQMSLSVEGFDPGPIDGIMGSKTIEALLGFQQEKGLEMTGVFDNETLQVLRLEDVEVALLRMEYNEHLQRME